MMYCCLRFYLRFFNVIHRTFLLVTACIRLSLYVAEQGGRAHAYYIIKVIYIISDKYFTKNVKKFIVCELL